MSAFTPSMSLRTPAIALACSLASLLVAPAARAAWPHDPSNGNLPISVAVAEQLNPVVIPDGSGGTIIAWEDTRGGTQDIYAQRVSAAGITLWTADGLPICTATNEQARPVLISDGSGGAIIAWQDVRTNFELRRLRAADQRGGSDSVGGERRGARRGRQRSAGAVDRFRRLGGRDRRVVRRRGEQRLCPAGGRRRHAAVDREWRAHRARRLYPTEPQAGLRRGRRSDHRVGGLSQRFGSGPLRAARERLGSASMGRQRNAALPHRGRSERNRPDPRWRGRRHRMLERLPLHHQRHREPAPRRQRIAPVGDTGRPDLCRGERPGQSETRFRRRGRGDRHVAGSAPRRRRLEHLRPACGCGGAHPMDHGRGRTLHRARRSAHAGHRDGRLGRCDRRVAGSAHHRVRGHLRPAHRRQRNAALGGQRRGAVHRAQSAVRPRDRRRRRGRRGRRLDRLPRREHRRLRPAHRLVRLPGQR